MNTRQIIQLYIKTIKKRYKDIITITGPIYFLIILLVPLVLTLLWFKDGTMLMAAEEGPLFYNPVHTAQLYGQNWTDSGLGLANPLITPRIPFYQLISLISKLSIPPVHIQQIMFYILMLIPLISIPLLVTVFFPKKDIAGKSAATFYLLNIYVQAQVWNRFLYPQMFLWSYLPLFLLLFSLWIRSFKPKFLLLLVISSFLYALTFSFVSSLFVLWIPAAIITTIRIISEFKNSYKIALASFFALLIWLISNIWWIIPIITIKDNNYSSLLDVQKNVTSVIEVSKYFSNSSLLLLKQDYYFNRFPDWYTTGNFNQVLIVIFIIVLIGVISYIKTKSGIIFAMILFVGWFVSKGTNSPLGYEFFNFLFSTFPVAQVFRNPYEKFGLVLLLPYAIFFGLGITKVLRNQILISLVVIYCCTTMVKPIWNGSIFNGYKATVPQDYSTINNLLIKLETHRSLSMPFLHTANVEYEWGYKGEELSELLLVKPSLSRTYNAAGDIYPLLYNHIQRVDFSNLFPVLAIDHIILHHDLIKHSGYQEDDIVSKNIIENWKDISLVIQTKNISLYKYNHPIQWGYAAQKLFTVKDTKEGFEQILEGKINPTNEVFTDKDNNPGNFAYSNTIPEYKIKKIASDHYIVSINNAKQPYIFVLSTTFNNNWQARINEKKVSEHFKVNGYANGWIIKNVGDYEIEIKFETVSFN